MEIFDVFSMNGIEKNPASGKKILENVILKVSQTHFSRISIPRGANAPLGLAKGGINFSRGGGQCPPRGGREVPCVRVIRLVLLASPLVLVYFAAWIVCLRSASLN